MAKKKNQTAVTEEALYDEGVSSSKSSSTKSNASSRAKSGASSTGANTAHSTVEEVSSQTAVDAAVGTAIEPEAAISTDTPAQSAVSEAVYEPDMVAADALADEAPAEHADAKSDGLDSTYTEVATQSDTTADTNATVIDETALDLATAMIDQTLIQTDSADANTVALFDALTSDETANKTVSSKEDAEDALSDYTYGESQAVIDAYKALEEYMNNMPDEYTSSYQEQIDALLEQILNREDFSYDFNADPLYQQYKNQYEHEAMLALQNTMAEMQGATGGYGSSYAAQAASGAYQSQINQLTGEIPELYELAYGTYSDKGASMHENLSALTEQEELAQSFYQDLIDNYYTGLESATEAAENAYNKDYQQFEDTRDYLEELLGYYAGQEQQEFENKQAQLAYELALAEYQERIRQFEAELAAQQSQWWAEFEASKASASSSASSYSGTSSTSGTSASSNTTDSADSGSATSGSSTSGTGAALSAAASDLKVTITQEMRVYAAEGASSSEINAAVASILKRYYQGGSISKDEANQIGATYGISI